MNVTFKNMFKFSRNNPEKESQPEILQSFNQKSNGKKDKFKFLIFIILVKPIYDDEKINFKKEIKKRKDDI